MTGSPTGAARSQVSWRAPGRVNVIGEHTDYNDGFVLPIALPLGVTATVTPRSGTVMSARSTDADGPPVEFDAGQVSPGSVDGWAAYVAGVVWSLREAGLPVPGAAIEIDGDVPHGAGLSSSAALECAVAAALNDAFDLGLAREALVGVAQRAENDFVGVPSGSLDQSASLLCEAGHALLLDTRSGERRQIPFDLEAHGLVLLVIDTAAPHRLVDGEYAKRKADCAEAARQLGVTALRDVANLDDALGRLDTDRLRRRVRHVVSENRRVLDVVKILDAGLDPREIGPLLWASHESLRDDYEVSSPELDLAAGTAMDAGARGARMTGGGFGGSAIAVTERGDVQRVVTSVTGAFVTAGYTPPRIFPALPSAGAHTVD